MSRSSIYLFSVSHAIQVHYARLLVLVPIVDLQVPGSHCCDHCTPTFSEPDHACPPPPPPVPGCCPVTDRNSPWQDRFAAVWVQIDRVANVGYWQADIDCFPTQGIGLYGPSSWPYG
ncbi:hypothetical protein F5144DRAFT_574967 [Chaetomium tenue]|uniref:Uncharacterized protein n=1 Tax=Chaetomium tenue TaxID=1854479 RepID=A0ACB7P8Q8_9PEZI|nr:hypothetical protein F5144DRAFT_574967 [Chaetomium globosum]